MNSNPIALDIAANRRTRKTSRAELARRVLWGGGQILFRLSPRPCFGWRRFVLRCFGAKLGAHVHTYATTRIHFPWNLTVGDWSAIGEHAFIYNWGPVTLGEKVTISHQAQLCAGTHDYTQPDLPLLKPPLVVESQAWICANAFVGPGVTVGEGAIVGACAVVTKNVEPWAIVAGNPAKVIKQRVLRPTSG
jgi:putative colanic acid biosynthesis acetyltransferase WcaF